MNNMQTPHTTKPHDYKMVLALGALMIEEGVDAVLVKKAVQMALDYEGTRDLMLLWLQMPDYRAEAVEAIKEEVQARVKA